MPPANDTPGVIAPPPLIATAAVVLGLLLDRLAPLYVIGTLLTGWPRIVIGALVAIAGGALALAGERRFKAVGTNVPPWKPALNLASDGIYAHLRNPMYAGLMLLVAGIGVGLGSDWMLVMLIPTALVLHHGVVLREERYLARRFGEPYRVYLAAVPRYGWPGLLPRAARRVRTGA
jgi:protein-S-isoprenylcysteine O-methyltransferase Ste14